MLASGVRSSHLIADGHLPQRYASSGLLALSLVAALALASCGSSGTQSGVLTGGVYLSGGPPIPHDGSACQPGAMPSRWQRHGPPLRRNGRRAGSASPRRAIPLQPRPWLLRAHEHSGLRHGQSHSQPTASNAIEHPLQHRLMLAFTAATAATRSAQETLAPAR